MTGSLQIKGYKYYAVLNFKDRSGKRVQKWIPLNLTTKGNKRRAESMLNELIVNYQGYESIEPMNILLFQHIMQWVEENRNTYTYFPPSAQKAVDTTPVLG